MEEGVGVVVVKQQVENAGVGQILVDGVLDQGQERVEIAVDVEDPGRFAMEAEEGPGKDFEEFLESTDAAGEDQEGIGAGVHESLALVHAGDDVEFGESVVSDFLTGKGLGDDADDAGTGGKGGVGGDAHQADPPPAVDQFQAAAGDGRGGGFGSLEESGVGSGARATKKPDGAW